MAEPVAEPSPRAPGARANLLLPGLYAWATTVALPAYTARAPGSARAAAVVALLALLTAPLFATARPFVSRVLGIHLFVGASALVWAVLGRAAIPLYSEPLEATLGALGWTLYAFGWGELRARLKVPEDDPDVVRASPLLPRQSSPRSVPLVFAIGVVGAVLFSYLAFRVTRSAHAVLAQAMALVTGILLLGAATRVALERTPRRLGPAAERLNAASTSLAVVLIALGLGALFLMLER